MALSFFIVLTEFVFYSKKELTRLEWFVRHFICLALVIVVIMLRLFLVVGASFGEPAIIIHYLIITSVVYPISTAIDYIRAVKSTNQLEKKLKERYKQN